MFYQRKWLNKFWYVPMREHYAAVKKNILKEQIWVLGNVTWKKQATSLYVQFDVNFFLTMIKGRT